MVIEVKLPSTPEPRLLDAEDFKGFKVVVRGPRDQAAAAAALASVAAWLDADHVAVDPAAVRRLAGETASSPEWEQGFAEMVNYAGSKGWIVDGAIRAHVEWEPA